MKVRGLMRPDPATVNEGDSLALALQIMRWRGIRHLPVMRGDRVVGVLGERDLLRIVGRGSPLTIEGIARDAMSEHPETIAPEADVSAAAAMLAANKIGCLPVIEGGLLIGIVTVSDVLALVAGDALPAAPPGP